MAPNPNVFNKNLFEEHGFAVAISPYKDSFTTIDSLVMPGTAFAPGLFYFMSKFDKSVAELFLEENNLPSSTILRVLAPQPLFTVKDTKFATLNAARQLYVVLDSEVSERFREFCLGVQINAAPTLQWRSGICDVPYVDFKYPEKAAQISVLCPYTNGKAYVPQKSKGLTIQYDIVRQDMSNG